MKEETIIFHRNITKEEYSLIKASNFERFPPCSEDYSVFHTMLNEKLDFSNNFHEVSYGIKYAVRKEFLEKYEKKQVGEYLHKDYCIPAEDLTELNQNLIEKIEITSINHLDK